MNIEYFQSSPTQLKVSLDFLQKWGNKVDIIFKNWADNSENKKCINTMMHSILTSNRMFSFTIFA